MDAVIRAVAVYFFLLLVFRLFGKRTLAQITTFEFVMLLIIAETTQQALLGDDFSLTNCLLLIATLVTADRLLAFLKDRSHGFERVAEGVPLVILKDGRPITDRLQETGVDVADILQAARETRGLERLEQIKYAILERSGGISIIPIDT